MLLLWFQNDFCCLRHHRTFETSLLVDESISDELPYSGEFTFIYHIYELFCCCPVCLFCFLWNKSVISIQLYFSESHVIKVDSCWARLAFSTTCWSLVYMRTHWKTFSSPPVCDLSRVFRVLCSRLHAASWRQHQDRKPELQTGNTLSHSVLIVF